MLHNSNAVLRALGVVVLVVAVQALTVTVSAWPAANIKPRDLPVVVAGPAPAADVFAKRLAQARPGAFAVTTAPDPTAADQKLRDRDAYGAFLVGPGGLAGVHLASAASPVVAQVLGQVAQAVGQGRVVPVDDVVPADPGDPRSTGLAAAVLPLIL